MKISTAQEAINGNSNDTVITPLRLKQVLNSKNIGGGGSSGGITKETDPIFTSSPAAKITDEDIENWNNPPIPDVPDEVQFGGSVAKEGADIWIKILRNLFNPKTVNSTSASFNSSGLQLNDFYYWGVSDYIEIEPNTDYTLSGITYGSVNRYHCWYDANKKLISTFPRFINTIKSQTYKSPSNAKYIRFSLFLGADDNAAPDERTTFQLEKGSSASPYIPYSEGESEILVRDADGTFKNLYELFPPDCDNESIIEETDPTVPQHVKEITQEDIDKWNSGTGGSGGGGVVEETDPTVPAHVKSITEAQIKKWDSGTGGNVDIDDITSKMSKVLYDNPTGSSTTVQLTETYNNFKYLEIFCNSSDNTHAYTRIENPVDGKRATVMGGWFGSAAYFKNCVLVLSGGDKINVTQGNNAQITGTNACVTASMADAMKVIKVVGYYDENVLIVGNNNTIDSVPIGSEFEYDGEEVPDGYEKIDDVITVDNVVSKNLLNTNKSIMGALYLGNINSSSYTKTTDYIPVKAGVKYTLSYNYNELSNTTWRSICLYETNKTYIKDITYDPALKEYSITADKDGYIRISYDKNCYDIQFEVNEKTSYVPYLNLEDAMQENEVYSTNEVKIGTWIDSKPIYRKVIPYLMSEDTSYASIATGITNMEFLVKASGVARMQGNSVFLPLTFYNSGGWDSFYVASGGANIFMERGSNYKINQIYFILEYTKTTD